MRRASCNSSTQRCARKASDRAPLRGVIERGGSGGVSSDGQINAGHRMPDAGSR
jgi:hypothetical protein